jgi:exosortase A-associated hydrolase 1
MPDYTEQPVLFHCGGERLVGMVHLPSALGKTGVVVVVGGPQYRVGSHRQFVLMARHLADNGIAVFRFDFRGMGDSDGSTRNFEEIGYDIKAAIDTFMEQAPGVERVALWGLCDAASAITFYAHHDSRVERLILLNPWVRTEAGEAKAYLRHYYLYRLLTRDFWKKLSSGSFEFTVSLRSLMDQIKRSRSGEGGDSSALADGQCEVHSLPERMRQGLERFHGGVRVILSGKDLTAAEFNDLIRSSRAWKDMLDSKQIDVLLLNESNHTFSRKVWRDQVADWTLEWVES